MNKIFYLFSNELRKSKYDYLFVIIMQLIIWTGYATTSILDFNKYNQISGLSIKIFQIINIDKIQLTVLMTSFLYTIFIWVKEFNLKQKSIYTIMMLPEKREYIYIVKFLNAFTMFFVNIILSIIFISCLCLIYSIVFKNGIPINPFEEIINGSMGLINFIPFTIIDFIVMDILVAASNISLISFFYLLNVFCANKKTLLKIIAGILSILGFILMLFTSLIFSGVIVILISVTSILVCYISSKYILKNIEF